MSTTHDDSWAGGAAAAESDPASRYARNRRSLLGAAGGFALAAGGLLLPERLAEAVGVQGKKQPVQRLRERKEDQRRKRRRLARRREQRREDKGKGKDREKPRGGNGTDDQGFVFVGSTTEVRGPAGLAVDGGRLFVANAASNSEGVRIFGIGAKGQLTLQGSLPNFSFAVAVDLDAAGRLYVADLFGRVPVFAIRDDGGGNRIAEIRGITRPNGVAAAGRFLFVSDEAASNVRTYRIVDGDPPTYESVATVAGFKKPGQLAYDGGRLYVADMGNDRIRVYGIDGRTGEATFKQNIPIPNPGGIAVGGGQLYVSCSRPGSGSRSRVQAFDLDADGAATPAAVLTKGDRSFTDPRGVALGRGFLFVADTGNNRVQVFRIR